MAELMTVETIIEADWQLQGFWTKPRFPIQTSKGGWSDIDVLAYDAEAKHLAISESKVQGGKRTVYAYTEFTKQRHGNILKYDDDHYFPFLRHVKAICRDGTLFFDFRQMVKRLTVQLVSNYFVAENVKPSAVQTVTDRVRSDVPNGVEIDVRLETTLDLICRIIARENVSSQGRRYGHPVIDIARELNRYMHPEIHDAGGGQETNTQIRKILEKSLAAALRGAGCE